MKDTTEEIYRKQFEIFMAKPLKERFILNLELTEFVIETSKKRIKRENPDFTEIEIKKNFFVNFIPMNFP